MSAEVLERMAKPLTSARPSRSTAASAALRGVLSAGMTANAGGVAAINAGLAGGGDARGTLASRVQKVATIATIAIAASERYTVAPALDGRLDAVASTL